MKRIKKAIKYFNAKWYHGHIRWLIIDKEKRNVSCSKCGNIANGVAVKKTAFGNFNVPLCKSHIEKLLPNVQSVPCFTTYNGPLIDLI